MSWQVQFLIVYMCIYRSDMDLASKGRMLEIAYKDFGISKEEFDSFQKMVNHSNGIKDFGEINQVMKNFAGTGHYSGVPPIMMVQNMQVHPTTEKKTRKRLELR